MLTIQQMKHLKDFYGISYEEISLNSGVPAATVQKVLTEETKSPRSKTLQQLRTYFDTYDTMTYDTGNTSQGLLLQEPGVPYGAKKKEEKSPVIYEEWPHVQLTDKCYTVEDYYALPDDLRVELIDGEFYLMASPSMRHQLMSANIMYFLIDFVRKNNGKCKVVAAPLDVQLDRDLFTMLQPDIMIICKEDRLTDRNIYGAPDLVMEILSPSNRKKDMILKRKKYFGAGVKEYWIIDPATETVEVCREEEYLVTHLYTFQDQIPVGIWENQCVIDMNEVVG